MQKPYRPRAALVGGGEGGQQFGGGRAEPAPGDDHRVGPGQGADAVFDLDPQGADPDGHRVCGADPKAVPGDAEVPKVLNRSLAMAGPIEVIPSASTHTTR